MSPALMNSTSVLSAFGAAVENLSNYQLALLGRGLREGGVLLTSALTVPIVAASAVVIKFSADFETSMTRVETLAGASKQEVDSLKQSVLDLGPAVGIGPAKLADGLFVLESYGLRGAEAMNVLTLAAKMSALGMGETSETARGLTGVLFAYKNQNLSAADAADILTKTVQIGNMKIGELVPALATINPLAAAMGVKFQDVAAAIATFTHAGVDASVASTAIRALLNGMEKDSASTEKGFAALAKATGDNTISMGNFRKEMEDNGLTAAMIHLMDSVSKGGEAGLAALEKLIPNIRAMTGALAVYKENGGMVVNMLDQLNGAQGTLGKSTEELQKTWAFQWDSMVSSVQKMSIELGDSAVPALKNFAGLIKDDVFPRLEDLIKGFNGLPPEIQNAAFGLTGFLAILGPGAILLGTFLQAIGNISRGMSGFSAAFGLIGISGSVAIAAMVSAAVAGAYTIDALLNKLQSGQKDFFSRRDQEATSLANKTLADAGINRVLSPGDKDDVGIAVTINTKGLAAAYEYLHIQMDGVTKAGEVYGPIQKELSKGAQSLVDAWEGESKKSALVIEAFNSLSPVMRANADVQASLIPVVEHMIETHQKVPPALMAIVQSALDSKAAFTSLQEVQLRGDGITLKTIDDLKAQGLSIQDIALKYHVTQDSLTTYLELLNRLHDIEANATTGTKGFVDAIKSMNLPLEDVIPESFFKNAVKVSEELLKIESGYTNISQAVRMLGGLVYDPKSDPMYQHYEHILLVDKQLDHLAQNYQNFYSILTNLAKLTSGADAAFITEAAKGMQFAGEATKALKDYNQAGLDDNTMGQFTALASIGTAGLGTAVNISNSAKGQSAGVGGLGGAISGAEFGAPFAAMTGGLSVLVGAVVGGLEGVVASLTGPDAAEVASRTARDTFMKQFQSTTDATGIQTIEDKITAIGISAEDAQKQIAAMLDAKTPEAFAAAMAPVAAEIKLVADTAKAVSSFTDLANAYIQAGHVMPPAMLDTIKQLASMPGLTDAERLALNNLVASATPNFETLKSKAAGLGITLEALGPQFEQGDLNQKSEDLWQTIQDLINAGGDLGGILSSTMTDASGKTTGLRYTISDLVQESKKFSTTIPDNMKPYIQNLLDAGLLTDADGQKVKNLDGVKFAPTMQTSLDTLNITMGSLRDFLLKLPGLIAAASGTINITTKYATLGIAPPIGDLSGQHLENGIWVPNVPDNPVPKGQQDAGLAAKLAYAATHQWMGGMVPQFAAMGKMIDSFPGQPEGTDTVATWLTPGEGVVNTTGMGVLGVNGLNRLNQGQSPSTSSPSSGGNLSLTFNIDGIFSEGDLETTINKKVLPSIISAWQDNRGSSRTYTQDALGINP